MGDASLVVRPSEDRLSVCTPHGSVLCHRRFAVTENPWFGLIISICSSPPDLWMERAGGTRLLTCPRWLRFKLRVTQLPDLSHLSHDEKDALIRALWAQVQRLTARVAELEARLGVPPKTP